MLCHNDSIKTNTINSVTKGYLKNSNSFKLQCRSSNVIEKNWESLYTTIVFVHRHISRTLKNNLYNDMGQILHTIESPLY